MIHIHNTMYVFSNCSIARTWVRKETTRVNLVENKVGLIECAGWVEK